jgi:hypothetical protein
LVFLLTYQCPVCGYTGLKRPIFQLSTDGEHVPSFDDCPSCGYEFGVTDLDRNISYDEWRKAWIDNGRRWHSSVYSQPENWDAAAQLSRLNGPNHDDK